MMNQEDHVTDEALIEAVQRGDRNAAACLYHRYIDRVHRICYRIVPDPSQVQDCVQEVWLKVFRKLGRFHCHRSFVAWLHSVTTHTAIDYYRQWARHTNHRNRGEIYPSTVLTYENPGTEQLDSVLIQERIREALAAISVNQRTAFVLRYYEEMPIANIALIIGCTEGAVRTHIRRSLLALRTKLNGKLDV
ncbi:RNA polymerase sigma factor [Planctomycetota bacterium]